MSLSMRVRGVAAVEEATAMAARSAHHRRRSPAVRLLSEVVAAVGFGLAVSLQVEPRLPMVGGVLVVWAAMTYHSGIARLSPMRRHLHELWVSAAHVLALVAVATGIGIFPQHALVQAVAAVVAASLAAWLTRLAWARAGAPLRTVLVGDRFAVAALATRWRAARKLEPVAAIVVEPDLAPEDLPREILGLPVRSSTADAPALVAAYAVDTVIVSPGPGFTSVDFRELSWALEGCGVSLGVNGVLDSVASHRVTPGTLGGATVMDVRASRPSAWVRGLKALLDRVVGAVLLTLAAVPLLALMAAIRLDSPGSPLFRQVRVGKAGRVFKVYKLRTMHADAERMKAEIAAANESDGVLFKIRRDPRITRVGRLLRRSSIDELPQLVNVLRGEMSLIGPRPALPEEVVTYDATARRRLAVRPGMTGLWQVSGRSDLGWEESVTLDVRYTDNWRLTDDLVIAARTFDAVFRARGAY